MKKDELYPDLKEIAKQSSYEQIFQFFYTLAQVRYATFKQLHPLNHRVVREKYLVKFCELGYLKQHELVKAYSITKKAKQLLALNGFNIKVLQNDFTGIILTHALKITDCLLKLQGSPEFLQVFYPVFREPPDYLGKPILIPDFCVVWKKPGAYKIQFGEVETEKPDWEQYLFLKREKYEQIAGDQNTYYKWWKVWAENLSLPFPKEADFCFSVVCFGGIKKEWEGWHFE